MIERDHDYPVGSVAAVAFDPELLEPALTGAITHEQWCRNIAVRLAAAHGDRLRAYQTIKRWGRDRGVVDKEVLAIVRHLRQKVPVVIFTNATSRLPKDLERLRLTDEVDAVVSSAGTGVAKPEPEAFRYAVRSLSRVHGKQLEAASVLVVDDSPRNVEVATELGFRAHLFNDAHRLRMVVDALTRHARDMR